MGPAWKCLFASEIGTSHVKRGDPCQDSAIVRSAFVNGEEFLIVACSDGAGSCPLSHEGSSLVCEAFSHAVTDEIAVAISNGIESVAAFRTCITSARQRLVQEATVREVS